MSEYELQQPYHDVLISHGNMNIDFMLQNNNNPIC